MLRLEDALFDVGAASGILDHFKVLESVDAQCVRWSGFTCNHHHSLRLFHGYAFPRIALKRDKAGGRTA